MIGYGSESEHCGEIGVQGKNLTMARDVSLRLRAFRAEFDILTQPAFASLCMAKSVSSVGEWMQAKSVAPVQNMSILCERRKLTLDWIYRGISPGMEPRIRRAVGGRFKRPQDETVASRLREIMDYLEVTTNKVLGLQYCGGASDGLVRSWWKSINAPHPRNMIALCETTGVTLDWIYRGVDGHMDPQLIKTLNDRIKRGAILEPVERAPRHGPHHTQIAKVEAE